MNKEKLKNLQQFYHNTLFKDVLPFWLNSDLIDKECAVGITKFRKRPKASALKPNAFIVII